MLSVATLLAAAYAFLNGVRDAGNGVSTAASTRVLRPLQAVVWAALFNLTALLVGQTGVSVMMATGFVSPGFFEPAMVIGALAGALLWNLIALRFDSPSSSTQALLGALAGAILVCAGPEALNADGFARFVLWMLIAPIVALIISAALLIAIFNIFARVSAAGAERFFRRMQLLSSAAFSLAHGVNDGQRTAGLLWLMVGAGTVAAAAPPFWIPLTVTAALACGTLVGGWRRVRGMNQRLIRLSPVGGFAAESAAALALQTQWLTDTPLSSTQTMTASLIGVGTVTPMISVRWAVAGAVLRAALLTLPLAGILGALAALLTRALT